MSTIFDSLAYWNGRSSYDDGAIRAYPVLAPSGAMPGSDAMDAWTKDARAWYSGWDSARLWASA